MSNGAIGGMLGDFGTIVEMTGYGFTASVVLAELGIPLVWLGKGLGVAGCCDIHERAIP